MEKIKIPPVVIKNFYDQYPAPVDEEWYSYPAVDIQYSWYDYNPYAFTVDPETYVVAFVKDNVPYKVVYGKNGEKISTHRILNTDLPSAITKRLSQGEYKDWTVGKDKEEIFRDKDTDQLKVYKLDVEKGTGKHTLYFQADGKLLKDRKVS